MKPACFLVGLFSIVLATTAWPCSESVGYFHRATRLQGLVVGVNDGDFRHSIRWMRLRQPRAHVELDLYEYQMPVAQRSDLHLVKSARSGENGQFDFGTIPGGHYMLVIDAPWGASSWFDVEILAGIKATKSVTIDISSVRPDCSGGHEFIVEN